MDPLGIRIAGEVPFAEVFASVTEASGDGTWILLDFPFLIDGDTDGALRREVRSQLLPLSHGFVTDAATMLKYSLLVSGDTFSMFGVDGQRDFSDWPTRYYESQGADGLSQFIASTTQVAVFAVDFAWWAVVAFAPAVDERLRNQWNDSERISLSEVLYFAS